MNFNRWYIYLLIAFLFNTQAKGQDLQYTQYYNAPLFLNPAFAGTGQNSRAAVNYRVQWPSINSRFMSYGASVDHLLEEYNSGVGILLRRDMEGVSGYQTTSGGLAYSYHVNLSKKWTFVPALQTSFVVRDADFNTLTFGDQLTESGHTGNSSAEVLTGKPRNSYFDFTTGGILYNQNFWIGLAAFHVNRPDQSFFNSGQKLPVRYSLHGGYKILLETPLPGRSYVKAKERSLSPTFLFMQQGAFSRLDLGAYLTYDPVMFGLWYRGIPVKSLVPGYPYNESIVMMIGLRHEAFSFGYSYDLAVSKLARHSGGAHEVSLMYQWEMLFSGKRRGGKQFRPVPCPMFHNP